MAGTKFAYVKNFELPDALLPGTYIVIRLDGHGFHRLSQDHGFVKPNDNRALQLMDHAATDVMLEFKDIVLAFGESDEYSFLFRKATTLYNRRHAKILSTVTSFFTSSYVLNWSRYLWDSPLQYPPSFDGRIILYPSAQQVRDYFSWRQADTHINNLYNTVFWALVQQGGETTTQAHATLRGTVSKTKHDILFTRFGINYNKIPERFRKGSVLVREAVEISLQQQQEQGDPELELTVSDTDESETATVVEEDGPPKTSARPEERYKVKAARSDKSKMRMVVTALHCDIIGNGFWDARPDLLQ